MKAAVFEKEGRLVIKDVPRPEIDTGSDDVLIEVEAVSICGTDVSIVKVPPAFVIEPGIILGHELVGHIAGKGKNVTGLDMGDRVVVNPNDYCGKCYFCRSNMPNLCENIKAMGVAINGAFAKFVKTTEKVCYRISERVRPESAVMAEPLACVINGTNKLNARPGETAVIMGSGPIGILFLQMFKASGMSKIIVSEPWSFRRDFAVSAGSDIIIDPVSQDLEKKVMKETSRGADIVVDAVGTQLASGIDIVRKGGRILVIGGKTGAVSSFEQIKMITKELRVMGTFLANNSFQPAVDVLESEKIDAGRLVTHTVPLDRIHEGIDLLKEGKAIKVMVDSLDI